MLLPKTHLLHVSWFCCGRLQAMDDGEKQETGEGKFEQGQGAVFGWFNALLGSRWFLPRLYHGWAAFQWKLKEWVRRVGVPSILLVSAWQRAGKAGTLMKLTYACWNNTIKFQIHFHGIGCPWTFLFLCAYPKVILASSFISFLFFNISASNLPVYTLQLFFFNHSTFTVSPGPRSCYPSPSQTAECLPEPSLPPLSPCAPFPSPLDGALCCHWVRHTALSASC